MGCDGGSVARRQDLVKKKSVASSAHSAKEAQREQVNTCAISQQPLAAPVVACALGRLYRREAVLEYLLSKRVGPQLAHIASTKDVCSVTLQWNAQTNSNGSSSSSSEERKDDADTQQQQSNSHDSHALYSCPITGLPSNGLNRFVAMQPCGCVISERAWKSVGGAKAEHAACVVCSKPLAADLNSSPPADASSAAAAAASSCSAAAAAALPGASSIAAPSLASSFHHPAFLTLFPGPEESLWLRQQLVLKRAAREAEKAARRAAAKKDKSSAAAAAAGSPADASSSTAVSTADALHGKRKADDQSVGSAATAHVDKKQMTQSSSSSSHHAAAVASRTGSSIVSTVSQITAAAAAAVAERSKDAKFSALFRSKEPLASAQASRA